ncbi:serine/threonine-protein kinase [Nocardioides panacisoli]|uniref:non-specific serine/threonine protein kinase n=1 Tax=Nocardioides panacisoli TaxID=627624 RepID=A0ABP7IXN8_9ACTN
MPMGADGSTLLGDRYRLGDVLGSGGMADVHRARDVLLDRDVAIKLLRPTLTSDLDQRRFAAETRMLARLNSPHLVMVLDAGVERASKDLCRPWFALELVDGPNLAQRIAAGPLPTREVASIGAGLATALAHVHARGIVHRDVKPANVLLSADGRPKLADFGVARVADDRTALTNPGHTVGTAAYLAPEQVRSLTVTGASDVYALGLVLLEALTGRRAYPGPPTEAALARLQARPVIPVSLGSGWTRLLDAMTAIDPADRPSAATAAARLSALAATEPASASVEPGASTAALALPGPFPDLDTAPTVVPSNRTGRSRTLLGVAAAVAVALVLGLAWFTSGSEPPPTAAAAAAPTVEKDTAAHTRGATQSRPVAQTEPAVSEPKQHPGARHHPHRRHRHHHRHHARHHRHHHQRHHGHGHRKGRR